MPLRDLHSNIKAVSLFAPAVVTADVSSANLDTRGFDSAELLVAMGQSGDVLSASVKFDLKLEASDDGVAYAPVTLAGEAATGSDPNVTAPDGNGVFATIDDGAEDERTYRIGYLGGKRFARVTVDATGAHVNGTPIGIVGLLGDAHLRPTSG